MNSPVSVGWSQLVGTNDCAREVEQLARAHRAQHLDQRALVEQVGLVELDPIAQVRDPLERLGARAPHHAVHLVSLPEQELREVGAVLAGDSRDQRLAHPSLSRLRAPRSSAPRLRSRRSVKIATATRNTIAEAPCSFVNDSAIRQNAAVTK